METSTAVPSGRPLRNLYFARTVVQLAWALLVFQTVQNPVATAILLVAYPLWDVACTLYDLATSPTNPGARNSRIANVVFGLATALAIALTVSTHSTYAIAAFGVWALAAGALQLVTGLLRRKQTGGQWAMILSGAQSSIAGITFVLGGLSGKLHAKDLGGYAIFGAAYFLVAGILLARKLAKEV